MKLRPSPLMPISKRSKNMSLSLIRTHCCRRLSWTENTCTGSRSMKLSHTFTVRKSRVRK